MTLDHLLVDCAQFNNHRLPIKFYLRKNNLALNAVNILDDDFPHNKLFNFLEATNFIGKI